MTRPLIAAALLAVVVGGGISLGVLRTVSHGQMVVLQKIGSTLWYMARYSRPS